MGCLGTGTLAARGSNHANYIITAAHCLTRPRIGQLDEFTIYFGATSPKCYDVKAEGLVEDCFFDPNWEKDGVLPELRYDYAACPIEFDSGDSPLLAGQAFGGETPNSPIPTGFIGYPAASGDGWMPYFEACTSAFDAASGMRTFTCSASGGESGGPLFLDANQATFSLQDMHDASRFIGGTASDDGGILNPDTNSAVDFVANSNAANNIKQWAGTN